ncbi:hypothetical protein J8F10_24365 [Gemmata sp. G18]|uniref:Gene product 88 domain-containing protein n=1 Tax=Gemmata palustris TaxID=2822762 RepID=A0ABS5BXB9_9BACT|nr:hypothetical protein [Gemmata palustris]MBP3958396.1 hypothetical protein [Gemmata palustris]
MARDVRNLLIQGNQKLSQAIFHWDLPAALTCPGSSELCREKCYALRRRYLFPQVQERLQYCYEVSKRKDFPTLMIEEIRRKGAAFVVRIHCAGDFFSPSYVRKWIEVVKGSPNTRFFGYSRSWRVQAIYPALCELAQQPNMRLFFSADSETGAPPELPENVRVAWMMVEEEEPIPEVDLIFRDFPLRKNSPSRIGLTLICPNEVGDHRSDEVNCGTCGFCWR